MAKKEISKKKGVKKNAGEKEKVCEVFEVEKESKKEEVKTCGCAPKEHANKGEVKRNNEILKYFFIGIGIFIIAFVGIIVFSYYQKNFEWQEIKFEKIRQGEIIFYHTTFPISSGDKVLTYNAYLRKDPRQNGEIPFEGNFTIMKNFIIVSEEDFICDGDGNIASTNMARIFGAIGSKIQIIGPDNLNDIQNSNASLGCDSQQRYTFAMLKVGNKTEIKQIGPACYDVYIKDCEILEGTERLILEMLDIMHEQFKKNGMDF